MDMDSEYVLTSICPPKKELSKFVNKFKLLSKAELDAALTISMDDLLTLVNRMVTCIGCRRSVEALYTRVETYKFDAFYPMYIDDSDKSLRLIEKKCDILSLWNLFYNSSSVKKRMLETLSKSKPGRRCDVHSLEAQRTRAVTSWIDVWDCMVEDLQDRTVIIDNAVMNGILDQYLVTHRFCHECKLKVLKAYAILLGDVDGSTESGYDPELYKGIETCGTEKHIHVAASASFITSLITKCIPELAGNSHRERHAKTIETAQEEVLICLGVCLFDRLHRVQQKFCAEERAWEIMMCVGTTALRQNFELAVEKKFGESHLDILCRELEGTTDKPKRTGKKSKRSNKNNKAATKVENDENEENVTPETPKEESEIASSRCEMKRCRKNKNNEIVTQKPKEKSISTDSLEPSRCSPTTGIDCGYLSGNNSLDNPSCSSPDGSETLSSVDFSSPKPYQKSNVASGSCDTRTPTQHYTYLPFKTLTPNEPYRSLEEQLDDLDLIDSSDHDDFEIPVEELAAILEPYWQKRREALRESMRTRFREFILSRQAAARGEAKHVLQSTSARSNARPNPTPEQTEENLEGEYPLAAEEPEGRSEQSVQGEIENKKSEKKATRTKRKPRSNPSSGHPGGYCSRRYKGKNRR